MIVWKWSDKMTNEYYYVWYVEYKEYPDICSKTFDDYIEQIKNFCSISIKYFRKLLKRQFKTDM